MREKQGWYFAVSDGGSDSEFDSSASERLAARHAKTPEKETKEKEAPPQKDEILIAGSSLHFIDPKPNIWKVVSGPQKE